MTGGSATPTAPGRTAIVTGAGRGIGAATAERLARQGYAVAVLDVDPRGAEVVARIRDSGGRAMFAECDVAEEDSWAVAVDRTRSELGHVDALVSNAMVTDNHPAHETTMAAWHRQLAVNLTGTFLGVRACLPDLRRSGDGAVVIVSSVHATFGMPGAPGYAATKAALTGLTRQLATEYGGEVRINAVLPGPVLTPNWDAVSEADLARGARATVMGRLGRPEEIATAICFLLGDEASFITGASLVVDGGWSISKDSP